MPAQTNYSSVCILLRQLIQLTLALLRLKAYGLVYLMMAATLTFSGAYLSVVLSWYPLGANTELAFYRRVGLDTAWNLLSNKASSNQTGLMRLAVERGLPWDAEINLSCKKSAKSCIQNLLSQTNGSNRKLLTMLRQSSESPVMMECVASKNPLPDSHSVACSLLYLLRESESTRTLVAFKELSFVRLKLDPNASAINFNDSDLQATTPSADVSHKDQKTACSSNNEQFRTVIALSVSVSTIAAAVYFTMSTAFCISKLKLHSFLKQQHHYGLCAIAYWLPIHVATLVESLLLTGVFMSGYMIQCHKFEPLSSNGLRISEFFLLHCLSLAMLAILFATIEANFGSTCLLMMLLNLILIGGFACTPSLISHGYTTPLYAYPPLNVLWLIEAHMASDGMKLLSAEELAHYKRVFACLLVTPIILAIAITYLDFVLPNGNGLCLPMYFPFSRKFWFPNSTKISIPNSTDPNLRPSQTDDDDLEETRETFIEPMPPDSVPSAVLDDVNAVYKNSGCSGGIKQVLEHVSCKIYPGQITWLLGSTGSGKSTLLKLLSGFSHEATALPVVASGSVTLFDGHRIVTPLDRLEVRRKVAAMLIRDANDGSSTRLTVKQCLAITLASRGCVSGPGSIATPRELLARLGLAGIEDQTVINLSPYQRQLLSLALSLVGNAQLILLDEPTARLEPAFRQRVWRLLRDLSQSASVSIVASVSRRDLPSIAPSERIIYLSRGQVAGIGSLQFLSNVFNCRRRCVTVTMLPSQSLTEPAATQRLLNQMPPGVHEHSTLRSNHKLKLLVEPQVLLQCLAVLESSVGDLISDRGIYLGHTQPLAPPRSSQLDMREDTTETSSTNNISESIHSSSAMQQSQSQSQSELRITKNNQPQINESLNTSQLIRLLALCQIQCKRLVRKKIDFVMRCVAPLLLLIGFLVLQDFEQKLLFHLPKAYAGNQFDALNSSAIAERIEAMRLPTACVYDPVEGIASALEFEACANSKSTLMEKPQNVSLKNFLMQSEQQSNLLTSCFKFSRVCAILHCSSWKKNETNENRSVTVVLLEPLNEVGLEAWNQHAYLHRKLIADIFNHFEAKLNHSDPVLAFRAPDFCHGTYSNAVSLLLILMFSFFPASFFNETADAFQSHVYHYLNCLGMKHLNVLCSTLFLYWLQYAIFFSLTVVCFVSWDNFRNSFFFICVYLPLLVFGTTSNLLSVYTTVVLTGCHNKTIATAYIAWAVVVPLALSAVSNLGNIPVLALIWMVPQVAPLALIQFGFNLVNQRVIYNEKSNDPLLFQIWDLQHDPWNYILMINSVLAMPIHLMLLSLLLSGSLCGIRKYINQHMDCLGKALSWNRCDQNSNNKLQQRNSNKKKCVLQVRNLWKTCPITGFPVVKGVEFELAAGQCVTLVGAKGSGRSMITAVIAGETLATLGECRIFCQHTLCLPGAEPSLHRQGCNAIGYCPRYAPLFQWLTVGEHLQFYAHVRGISSNVFSKRILELISQLGLTEYWHSRVSSLDDLTRRLVCLAIALLARPLLLIINNGSLGDARRFLRRHNEASLTDSTEVWNTAILATAECVRDARETSSDTASEEVAMTNSDDEDQVTFGETTNQKSQSISSGTENTSHANVFCLLHRGCIAASGTSQQLRSIYGNWYFLDVTMQPETAIIAVEEIRKKQAAITDLILQRFRSSLLLEECHRWLQFCLPEGAEGRLSSAWKWLDANLAKVGSVQQFQLYRMSLDQAIELQKLNVIKRSTVSIFRHALD